MNGKRLGLSVSAAIFTVGSLAPALAQDNATGAAPAAAESRWTSANVLPSNPFGSIDVTPAGTTSDSVLAFAEGLTGRQVVELLGRCVVINPSPGPAAAAVPAPTPVPGGAAPAPDAAPAADAAPASFPASAVQFCRNLMRAIFGVETMGGGGVGGAVNAPVGATPANQRNPGDELGTSGGAGSAPGAPD